MPNDLVFPTPGSPLRGMCPPGNGTITPVVLLDVGGGGPEAILGPSNPAPVVDADANSALIVLHTDLLTVESEITSGNSTLTNISSGIGTTNATLTTVNISVADITTAVGLGTIQTTSLNTVVGTEDDAAAVGDTGTFSLVAAVKRILARFTSLLTLIGGGLPAGLGSGGGVKVDGSGTALPVSGTFWQAVQPVSGSFGISGSVSVTGTFWQNVQPVSASALPLPTGAATSANQASEITSLASIASALGASLPLPSGASTAALQTTMEATLTSILSALSPTRTIVTVPFSLSASGTLVAAVAGKRIKVFAYSLNSSLATLTVAFNSAGTAMTGAQSYIVGGGPSPTVDPPGFLFATAAGALLGMTIVGIGTVSGFLSYWADDSI